MGFAVCSSLADVGVYFQRGFQAQAAILLLLLVMLICVPGRKLDTQATRDHAFGLSPPVDGIRRLGRATGSMLSTSSTRRASITSLKLGVRSAVPGRLNIVVEIPDDSGP